MAAEAESGAARRYRTVGPLLATAVVIGLIGLPVAVWLDLRVLSERMLRTQAGEISRIIDSMRSFYGSDVVGRILAAVGSFQLGALVKYFDAGVHLGPIHLTGGYPAACTILSFVYVIGMILIWFAPETKGQPLPE